MLESFLINFEVKFKKKNQQKQGDDSIAIYPFIYMVYFPWRWNYIFIKLQASANQRNLDVGANIFIGNLDPEVDEKLLYDTFSAFGVILQTPKVRKNETF